MFNYQRILIINCYLQLNLPNLVAAVAKAVTMEHLSSARVHAAAQAVRTLTGDIG
jgi:hypothetical protein